MTNVARALTLLLLTLLFAPAAYGQDYGAIIVSYLAGVVAAFGEDIAAAPLYVM